MPSLDAPLYIRQQPDWPMWRFDAAALAEPLAQVLTQEVIKTSEIEGEQPNVDTVRSSIARRLGVDIGALAPADRYVDGVVDMVLDATGHFSQTLSAERLFGWHAALFPTSYSGWSPCTRLTTAMTAYRAPRATWRWRAPRAPANAITA